METAQPYSCNGAVPHALLAVRTLAGGSPRQPEGPGNATPGTAEAMTESEDLETPEATPSPTAHPSPAPSQPGSAAEDMHTETDNNASGETHSPGTLPARNREMMPPPKPMPPHSGDTLGLEELQRAYDVYHRMLWHDLVDNLRADFHDARPDWRCAAALPHMELPTSACCNSRHSSRWNNVLRRSPSTCECGGSTTTSQGRGTYGSTTSPRHTR